MKDLICGFFLLSLVSCNNSSEFNFEEKRYIFLSHTRTDVNDHLISEVTNLGLEPYDMVWLGGDLLKSTTLNEASVSVVDSIFDLSSPNTLFSFGNHDYQNPELLTQVSNRSSFYSYAKNDIAYFILDTELNKGKIMDTQLDEFKNTTSNLTSVSHFILIHHRLIWMVNNDDLEFLIPSTSNAQPGECPWCLNDNNFYRDIYPILKSLQENGTQVICLGGDMGNNESFFEYQTSDGVIFLGSGMNSNITSNTALVFDHNIKTQELTWEEILLSELPPR